MVDKLYKFNLGCGENVAAEFINVDLRNLKGVTVVADLRALSFKDGSAKLILLYDVLEHFTLSDALGVLKECYRLLAPNGEISLTVPDLIGLADKIRSDDITPFVYQEFIYGGQDYKENLHLSGYTPQFLAGIAVALGFRRVDLVEKVYPNIKMLFIK